MRSTTRIPIWRTFVNWAAVVLVGSIIAPILLSAFEVEHFNVGIIPGFMLVSAVCSLPAVGVFILVNWGLNLQKLSAGRYCLWQGLIHLGVSILTFLVIGFMNDGLGQLDEFLLVVGGTYTVLGQIAWALTFFSHREGTAKKPENKELLDDLSA
jgi:hypothetical protein